MVHVDNFSYGALNPVLAYVMSCMGCFIGLRCTTRARASQGLARAGSQAEREAGGVAARRRARAELRVLVGAGHGEDGAPQLGGDHCWSLATSSRTTRIISSGSKGLVR